MYMTTYTFQESLDLLDSTQEKLTQKLSNLYLQVLHSPQWDVIPEAVKTKVTKSTFLFDCECKPANKPTLSSSKVMIIIFSADISSTDLR